MRNNIDVWKICILLGRLTEMMLNPWYNQTDKDKPGVKNGVQSDKGILN